MPSPLPVGAEVVILDGQWKGRVGEVIEHYGKSVKVRLRPPAQPRPELVWVGATNAQIVPVDG